MQEAVVGAAASKTQAMRGGCWEPQSELVSEEKATRRTCITSFLWRSALWAGCPSH